MGTWEYCWFWLLNVNLLEAKWLLCALVKSKINTWYCGIIALRSCFMWYSKPLKKTIVKSLNKLRYLRESEPAVSKRGNNCSSSEGSLMKGMVQIPYRSSVLWGVLKREINFSELPWRRQRMDRIQLKNKIKRFLKWFNFKALSELYDRAISRAYISVRTALPF